MQHTLLSYNGYFIYYYEFSDMLDILTYPLIYTPFSVEPSDSEKVLYMDTPLFANTVFLS